MGNNAGEPGNEVGEPRDAAKGPKRTRGQSSAESGLRQIGAEVSGRAGGPAGGDGAREPRPTFGTQGPEPGMKGRVASGG